MGFEFTLFGKKKIKGKKKDVDFYEQNPDELPEVDRDDDGSGDSGGDDGD
jgi:hypothetical protein